MCCMQVHWEKAHTVLAGHTVLPGQRRADGSKLDRGLIPVDSDPESDASGERLLRLLRAARAPTNSES